VRRLGIGTFGKCGRWRDEDLHGSAAVPDVDRALLPKREVRRSFLHPHRLAAALEAAGLLALHDTDGSTAAIAQLWPVGAFDRTP
jgi:hypothetical protein